MRFLIAPILALSTMTAVPAAATAAATQRVHTEHMDAALVAENRSLVPGQTNWVGLELRPQKGWHSYWRNAGEAGLATHIDWTLPAGVTAGSIVWPTPTRLETTGLVDYGYAKPTLLMVPLHVPADQPIGKNLAITAHGAWLVCKDICIPGDATLRLNLPTAAGPGQPDSATAALFSDARARLPQALPQNWRARYQVKAGGFSLGLVKTADSGPPLPAGHADFYPVTTDLIDYSAPQYSTGDAHGVRLSTAQSRHYQAPADGVRGVLAVTTPNGRVHAYKIDATAGTVAAVPPSAATPASSASVEPGLALALLFALLGGLILNLMPCVFPVLSIKAIAVLRAGAMQRKQQRRQGLAYTVGTVLACVTAAGALLALRAGGEALCWGFQLQSPLFVALLACLMFALGLSLSGVVSFGTRWMGAGQNLTQGHGMRSAFFTGVLAVVVASPCTAPFMGTAMGYALAQPTVRALSIFAALGLGLALPFLAIGLVPRLAARLPRPGAWMETFKQLMAFPLYLTAVWLVWVLARQSGPDAAALVLAGMVLLGLVLWLRGRWPRARLSAAALVAGMAGVVALSAQAARLAVPATASAAASTATTSATATEAWSPTRLAALRKAGRTVFVDFTADWCLTCKVNERLTLDSTDVRQAFARNNVVYLKADWTRRDPEITAALAHFGRAGVPLYVVFRHGGAPEVLPQLLTASAVTAAVGG